MIRPATPQDAAAVTALAVSSGLFPPEMTSVTDTMMADYFGRRQAEGHVCVIDEEQDALGVAYYLPRPATDRTWELLMIAVRAGQQGRGRGRRLLQYMEEDLRARGQRLLLIETSGDDALTRTRDFYLQNGYGQEARVRDYYAAGEDMVLFRKVLNGR